MSTSASSRSFISCPCPMFQCVRAHVRAHACDACIYSCAYMLACMCAFRREGRFARLFGC